jgi:hypothetical protein
MRNGKDRASVVRVEEKIRHLETVVPPVSALEALRRNALYHLIRSETAEEDGQAIHRKIVEKAREGDVESQKLYHRMMSAGTGQGPRSVSATQVNVFGGAEAGDIDEAVLLELRRQIVFVLEARAGHGMKAPALAREFNVRTFVILLAVQHPWFRQEADGWHLTATAEAEVLSPPA